MNHLGRPALSHGLPAKSRVVYHVHPGGLHHSPGVPDLLGSVFSVYVVLLVVGPGGPGAPLVSRQSPQGAHLGAGLTGAGVELTTATSRRTEPRRFWLEKVWKTDLSENISCRSESSNIS